MDALAVASRPDRRRAGLRGMAALALIPAFAITGCGRSSPAPPPRTNAIVDPQAVGAIEADHRDVAATPPVPVLAPSPMSECRNDPDPNTGEPVYYYEFTGRIEGVPYLVDWALDPYHGPGLYRVSGAPSDFTALGVHTPAGDLLGLGHGTIEPAAPRGRTGTLDVDVALASGRHVRVAGNWDCGGAL